MARKPRIPNQPSILGADGRHYTNPAYFGFPDPGDEAAKILQRVALILTRTHHACTIGRE
jgi:hypothetical protein